MPLWNDRGGRSRSGRVVNPAILKNEIAELTTKLTGAVEKAAPFLDPPHPGFDAVLTRDVKNAETARQDQKDMIIGVALMLIGGGGANIARMATSAAARKMGARVATADIAGTGGVLALGGANTVASMADAYRTARRDVLQEILDDSKVDMTDPVQVHTLLKQRPDLAKHISDRAIEAAGINFFAGKFGKFGGEIVEVISKSSDPLLRFGVEKEIERQITKFGEKLTKE